MVLESVSEKLLKDEVEAHGGLCWKFESPQNSGVPDRIIIMPDGWICFIEMKQDKGITSPLQRKKLRELRSRSADAFVVKGHEGVRQWVQIYLRGYTRLKVPSKSQVLDYPE